MKREEVKEYLAKIEDYIPISLIERELKMPANTLQKVVTENPKHQRDLPKTWEKRFKDFINFKLWVKIQMGKKKKPKEGFHSDELGGNTIAEIFDSSRVEERMKPVEGEKSISQEPYNIIPPMPKKEDFKHSVDYGAAKSEWKLKYGQK